MKPNKLHEELCDTVIILTKIWKYTIDINSPIHYKNNKEHINQFVIENKISKEDAEQLTNALDDELKQEGDTYYIIRKQLQYPKDYNECCKIVNASPYVTLVYNISDGQKYSYDVDNLQIYDNLRKLKICRDAYWKITGEQMGLGKPWKPDWSTENEIKYVIEVYRNNVRKNSQGYSNTILAFPTSEMCDAFYENFKEFINECKELL